ncbi:hypothetical protein Ahy_B05g077625 [Arachis hypogaea]|uniref:Arginine decarboxylase n=1 Tax=Arachis hypogaea TaxID=3818 RepID=A0A444Z550_ARAHY|nr:hypothetical protein Ahy_B05g077625 [Arachis hypogaea]
MVHFPDILKNCLESLQSAFYYAIQSRRYGSHYQGVYPVKCNQDQFIVEDILALNTVIVLEQEEELDMIIDLSKKLCIRPVIGFRAKLRTKHSGHFGSTSGEKGKFGLTTAQIVRVMKKLQILGMLDCLQLLHFHIGSMIPSTLLLAHGVSEAAQICCELKG